MAEVITDNVFNRSRNGERRYRKFLDGQTWKLTRGVDFTCSIESLKSALSYTAKSSGLRIRTKTDPTNPDVLYTRADPK